MWCMLLRVFLSNPFELIDMWEKMIVIVKNATHGTCVIGLNTILIPWWSRVDIILLLLRRGCKRLVPILWILV